MADELTQTNSSTTRKVGPNIITICLKAWKANMAITIIRTTQAGDETREVTQHLEGCPLKYC